MGRWSDVAAADPVFAEKVRELFDAHRHKTLATLRRDGSPRISGIEMQFARGEVVMGMMPDSMKLKDVQRDPRVAVHSASDDPPKDDPSEWRGDAKISGLAVKSRRSGRIRIDIKEVVLTRVGKPADHLVIESWHEGRGMHRRERR